MLACLLVQRFGLLLERKKKNAKQVFQEAKRLILKNNFTVLYIDLHMILGDHNWKGTYKSKLNAMQAYLAALIESFSDGATTTPEIGSHIINQLLGQPVSTFNVLIDKLERDTSSWLFKQFRKNNIVQCLLWPFRAARKMYPYRFKPEQLKNRVEEIIAEEVAVINKKVNA